MLVKSPSTLLQWALTRETNGDLIGAGVCLRAAMYYQLLSMARSRRCLPKLRDHWQRPGSLASALCCSNEIDDDHYTQIREALEVGNVAAHAGDVDAVALRSGLLLLESMLAPEAVEGGVQ
jgi:hypothetical protein